MINEAALRDARQAKLACYEQPKRLVAIDEIPRKSMAEVQKALLRERLRHILDEVS